MKHTILSLQSDPGNADNMRREIGVEDHRSFFCLTLTNHWLDGKSYDFNISRKAAEELAATLDVMLCQTEGGPVEIEKVAEITPIPGLPWQVRCPMDNTLWAAFAVKRDAEQWMHRQLGPSAGHLIEVL